MLTAGDFKNGVTFEMEGKVYQVIEFQHVKPGKGAAFVRTKYKDVMTGTIREQSFNPTAKFENAVIDKTDRRSIEYPRKRTWDENSKIYITRRYANTQEIAGRIC